MGSLGWTADPWTGRRGSGGPPRRPGDRHMLPARRAGFSPGGERSVAWPRAHSPARPPARSPRSCGPAAASAGGPDDRVPVWFMRQAGRSLPEYRAIRGHGSILDAIRDPELSAEITLQPVRRYGVDAAILYSDIVVPVAAIGFGVDVAPGVGPGRRAALRTRRRPPAAPTPRPRGRHALRLETVRILAERAPGPADRLRRGAVHRGQLPDRGTPVPHLRRGPRR